MTFLADMGISSRTVNWLRNEGHQAVHLVEQDLYRFPDAAILQKARDEERVA